jgi:hypothetical protein
LLIRGTRPSPKVCGWCATGMVNDDRRGAVLRTSGRHQTKTLDEV